MSSQSLEHLTRQLIRLCDEVELHGLVDYQMGVAEEEIVDRTCAFDIRISARMLTSHKQYCCDVFPCSTQSTKEMAE